MEFLSDLSLQIKFQWSLFKKQRNNSAFVVSHGTNSFTILEIRLDFKKTSIKWSYVSWAASKFRAPLGSVELPKRTENRCNTGRNGRDECWIIDVNFVAWEISEIDSQSAKKARFPFLIYLCKHFSSVHAKKEKVSLKMSAPSTHDFVLLRKHFSEESPVSFENQAGATVSLNSFGTSGGKRAGWTSAGKKRVACI